MSLKEKFSKSMLSSSRTYTLEDFIVNQKQEIEQPVRDFNYFKNIFGDKMDDEMLALFEMLEDENISKKQLNILSMILNKTYQDKFKDVNKYFLLTENEAKELNKVEHNILIPNGKFINTLDNIEINADYFRDYNNQDYKTYEKKEPNPDYDEFLKVIRELEKVELE